MILFILEISGACAILGIQFCGLHAASIFAGRCSSRMAEFPVCICVIALLDFDSATTAQVSEFLDPPVLVLGALLLIVFNGDTV
jgi:hypothetical protein